MLPLTLSNNIDNIEGVSPTLSISEQLLPVLSECFIIDSYSQEPIHAIPKEFKSMAIQNSHNLINMPMCVLCLDCKLLQTMFVNFKNSLLNNFRSAAVC